MDGNDEEATSHYPENDKADQTARIKSRSRSHDVFQAGDLRCYSMKHNIHALSSLYSIYAIPNNRHYSPVECRPPRAEYTKGSSVQDRETALRVVRKVVNEGS